MDLTPSAGYAQQKVKSSGRGTQASFARNDTTPAGAIRRTEHAKSKTDRHPKFLYLAVMLLSGAVIWTASESRSLTINEIQTQESSQAITSSQPSFFFDDAQDALASTRQIHQSKETDTAAKRFRDTVNGEAQIIASIIKGTVTGRADALSDLNRGIADSETDAETAINPNAGFNRPDSIANAHSDATATTDNEFWGAQQTFAAFSPDTRQLPDNQKSGHLALLTKPADDQMISVQSAVNPAAAKELSRTSLDTNPQHNSEVYRVTVSSGDTLSGILNENGLSLEQIRTLLENDTVKDDLSNIAVNQVFSIARDIQGNFKSLTTRISEDHRVNITRTDSGFDIESVALPIQTKRVVTSGSIDQSLFLAAEQAEIQQSTIMELANVFQWDLDFERDIQKGDRFSLIYDKQFREGEYIGDGDILAAEFVRGQKSHIAIRVDEDNETAGYYSPDGSSKRRTFMRHPVDIVRITSKFNPNRLHPVLHQIRAHRGVDYGSPYGSPIYATADGRVVHADKKGAYGNTVILKHGEKFSTLYAHMSRISDKSKVGTRVNQGDVIGYVGNTGRVTGTHLHYEFRVNGEQIDPLEIELPAAQPLAQKYMPQLRQRAMELSELMSASLESGNEEIVVSNDPQHRLR